MYKLMAVRENNGLKEFGVLDTDDYSVDFVDIDVIRECFKKNIKIKGLGVRHIEVGGHIHKEVTVCVQPYDIPKKVCKKVDSFLVSEYERMCYNLNLQPMPASDVLCSIYCVMAKEQQQGVNLLTKYKDATGLELFNLTC